MFPFSWKPITAGNLVRLGRDNDGGYVVSRRAACAASVIVGLGLSDDWSFEESFIALSGGRAVCFDHTVTENFWRWYAISSVRRFKFKQAAKYFDYRRFFNGEIAVHRRLKIGYDRGGEISLKTVLAELDDEALFLKVDIEGAEYRILDDIIDQQARLTGLVIELHDIDLHRNRIDDFIRRMTTFDLVALHGNNFGGVDSAGDPLVVEASFTRRDLIDPPTSEPSAEELGMPCDSTRPEITLGIKPGNV